MNKYNKKEINFLIKNYPIYGYKFCQDKLNRSKHSVQKKVRMLGIKRNANSKYEINTFTEIIKKSKSYTDAACRLNLSKFCGNRNTIKKYIKKYNIDILHFDSGISNHKSSCKKKLSDILIENSTYCGIKNRLYKEGLKEKKCELCNQDENWNGKKMSLTLDHINGINNDNRIENLRIICPNCDATLDTYGGRNIKIK